MTSPVKSAFHHILSFDYRTVLNSRTVLLVLVLALVFRVLYKIYQLFQGKWKAERELAQFDTIEKHWLFGHLGMVKNDEATMQAMLERSAEASPVTVMWLGPFMARVLVNHPLTMKAVLTSTEPKDDLFYRMLKPWLGDGLLISSDQKWFRNRRLLTPGFHFDILRPYVDIYNECTQTMMEKWSDQCQSSPDGTCVLEMFENISLMTLDTLLKCIFSQESNCQRDKNQNPYIRGVYALSYLIAERIRLIPYHNDVIWYFSRMGYRYRRALRAVHDYSKRVVEDRKRALKAEDEMEQKPQRKYIDFLDILLRARDEDGHGLTDQEVQDEVDTFMFEGHDTTASGISWCLYNMAANPEHQQKCREEIDQLLMTKENREIGWNDIGSLPYTTMCIKESLRSRSPVPLVARYLNSPLGLHDGRIIPAGNVVMVSINALHHNPEVWPEPTKYDPLRFLPENSTDRSPYAYLPFSAGSRNCIGQNFAMNEMKVAIATTLSRFELFPVEGMKPERTNNLVLRSSNGIHLRVKPRNMKC